MKSRLLPIQELKTNDIDAMFKLFSEHFHTACYDVFHHDLHQKNWVLQLYEEKSNIIKGFSTILLYSTDFAGEKISVIYSGDTIVHPDAWSSSTLSKSWIASIHQLRSLHSPDNTPEKLYWLLISSGYRSYRFLPLFWQEFYPRYDQPTPKHISALINAIASSQFGENYDVNKGVVCFPHPQVLTEKLNGIPPERLQDPHINFFQQRNPGHIYGDELVCLTEICETNLTSAGRRMWFAI